MVFPAILKDFEFAVPLNRRTRVESIFERLQHYSDFPSGGVLPYKRLMGMCRWMGSHFHDWSDYNGVAFSIDLLEWGRKF